MRGQVPDDRTMIGTMSELERGGELGGGTPFWLYSLAAKEKATGRLVLVDIRGVGWELSFRRGVPHYVRTTAANLGLGRYLLAQQALSPEELNRAQAQLREEGGELLDVLCRNSSLDYAELFRLLAGYGRALLVRALALDGGSYRWESDAQLPSGAGPLGDPWVLACEAGRRLGPQLVLARLGSRVHLPIQRTADRDLQVENLGLNSQEARLAASFDGIRSLAQIAAAAPQETELIYRTGYFLSAMGVASFIGEQGASKPGSAGGADQEDGPFHDVFTPSPVRAYHPRGVHGAPASAREGGEARAEARPNEEEVFLASLEDKDHFEVLELPRTASSTEIKRSYFRLARLHHPDTTARDSGARKAKERITARLNEAYAVLNDDASRASYLEELELPGGGEEVDIAHILEAEKHFQRGALLVKARQFKEALAELDEAIGLNDGEGEYYAWRAYARFSGTPDKRQVASQCKKELELALEKSPNCAVAFLFSARIATVLGDVPGAIQYYKRCLALEPGNVEAKRELRLLETRNSK